MARKAGNLVVIRSGGAVVLMFRSLGMVPGIEITAIGGLNGAGKGTLRYDGTDSLAWTAPGSSTRGADVDVSAGGSFTLFDGADLDKWIDVDVTAAYLPSSYQSAVVQLSDIFNNGVASTDRATTAGTADWTTQIKTTSGTVDDVAIWLAPDLPENRELSIRWGGVGGYHTCWNEIDGLAAFGGSLSTAFVDLDFRRVVADVSSPKRLVRGWVSWDDGEGGRAKMEFRGAYRITQDVLYEAYEATGTDPVPGIDAPLATSPTVPFTPSDAHGDNDDYRLALVKVNRHGLRSSPRTIIRKRIAAGADAELLPNPPASVRIVELLDGITRVLCRYMRPVDSNRQATHFHVWYTTDGSTPGTGDPDFQTVIRWVQGRYGLLDLRDIPQQANGVTVKVLVKMRRASTVVSATGVTANLTIDTGGPSAPLGDGEIVP